MPTPLTLYAVAKIVGCFGVKGYLKIRPQTQSPDRLKSLAEVYVGASEQEAVPSVVEDVLLRGSAALVKLRTISDRSAAEAVVGQFLFVDEKSRSAPLEGSYFVDDLVGCGVWSTGGEFLGTLKEVYRLPAQDVWAVERNGRVFMVPAVKEFVERVELTGRRIVIRVIEGLFEA